MEIAIRPRRLRTDDIMRDLVRETRISKNALIYPIFIKEGQNIMEDISSLDGQKRYSPDKVSHILERVLESGIRSVLLFGIPEHKDEWGSAAHDESGALQKAIRLAKRDFPEIKIITDVCLCEYTSHGHCGVLRAGEVVNDETVELLARTAASHVAAGADVVAPSDMMDGRVAAIRAALPETPIVSYAAKYASAFYGPFREVAESTPSEGDRRGYQMDPANVREALRECQLDLEEGADALIIKPALPYLDVIKAVRDRFDCPVWAYNVSGEYAMVRAAGAAGHLDEERAVLESLTAIKRAGAGTIITYWAKDVARWL